MSHLQDIGNSPLRSPVRKRPRLESSPSFSELSPLEEQHLSALDEIEKRLTQCQQVHSPSSRKGVSAAPATANPPGTPSPTFPGFALAVSLPQPRFDLHHEPLFRESSTILSKPLPGFASASSGSAAPQLPFATLGKRRRSRSLSPFSPPTEPDYSKWFEPLPEVQNVPQFVSFGRPMKEGGAKCLVVSEEKLKLASQRIRDWEADETYEPKSKTIAASQAQPTPAPTPAPALTPVPAPKPTPPLFKPPLLLKTPRHSLPKMSANPITRSRASLALDGPSTPRPTSSTPSASLVPPPATEPTKSRVYNYHASHPAASSTPASTSKAPALSFTTPTPLAHGVLGTPVSVTGKKVFGMNTRSVGRPQPKFKTPFKAGLAPGEPGRLELERKAVEKTKIALANVLKATPVETQTATDAAKKSRQVAFDLKKPPNRRNLRDHPAPQRHTSAQLARLGLNPSVGDIENWNAPYWAFGTDDGRMQDANHATEVMRKDGCTLVKEEWVQNHWGWIVWKLANTVCLWPEREGSRWAFEEVLKQLKYRYEREINQCKHPAIRLIQERDASPASAMVLCVFEINWPAGGDSEGSTACPEFVLTDGWYKIRAKTDQPLARAARKGKIRVGRKLGIIGARLDSVNKDPDEVLKSFDASFLVITGNGTQLASWDAKLGFQRLPFIATLNSLTPDGGLVVMTGVQVQNAFPIQYVETLPSGEKEMRSEEEESTERDRWEKRRADEHHRLKDEIIAKVKRLQGFTDRLIRVAGLDFRPGSDDCPPDDVEDLVDELEEHADPAMFLKSISAKQAGWMARHIEQRCQRDSETLGMEIESELARAFPARNVRAFRILLVKDGYLDKKPSLRTAQVTVWDADAMEKDALREGKKYLVANLVPTMARAWGKSGLEGQVFLSTRRDTKWTRMV